MTIAEMRDLANGKMSIEEAAIAMGKSYNQYVEVTRKLYIEVEDHIRKARDLSSYKNRNNAAAKKEAKKELDQAIAKLKKGMKDADKIDDENAFISVAAILINTGSIMAMSTIFGVAFNCPEVIAAGIVWSFINGVSTAFVYDAAVVTDLEKKRSGPNVTVGRNRAFAKLKINNYLTACEKLRAAL